MKKIPCTFSLLIYTPLLTSTYDVKTKSYLPRKRLFVKEIAQFAIENVGWKLTAGLEEEINTWLKKGEITTSGLHIDFLLNRKSPKRPCCLQYSVTITIEAIKDNPKEVVKFLKTTIDYSIENAKEKIE